MVKIKTEQLAVIIALSGFFLRALELFFTRQVRQTLPAVEVTFFRFAIGLFFVSVSLWLQHKPVIFFPQKDWKLFYGRNLSAICALFLLMVGIPHLSLGVSSALYYFNPIFIALFALLILKERGNIWVYSAIAIGFTGVILVANAAPSAGNNPMWAILVVGTGALFVAPADLCLKALVSRHHDSIAAVVSYFSFGASLFLPLLPFFWITPDRETAAMLVVMALCGALFQWMLGKANSMTLATRVAPLKYSVLLWSQLLDVFVLGLNPNALQLTGMLVIALAGTLATISRGKRTVRTVSNDEDNSPE